MYFDIKSNKSSKKMSWVLLGLFSRKVVFVEVLKLKNLYKIASSLSNAITFLKKMLNNKIQRLMSIWVIIDTFKSDDVIRRPENEFQRQLVTSPPLPHSKQGYSCVLKIPRNVISFKISMMFFIFLKGHIVLTLIIFKGVCIFHYTVSRGNIQKHPPEVLCKKRSGAQAGIFQARTGFCKLGHICLKVM